MGLLIYFVVEVVGAIGITIVALKYLTMLKLSSSKSEFLQGGAQESHVGQE